MALAPLALSLLLLLLGPLPSRVVGSSSCSSAVVFNFGDSNSDTGGLMAGLGYQIPSPYGRQSFHHSTGRLCDGRLVLDFLCESVKMGYLSPYLESLGSNFSNGANFAISGSTTLPPDRPFALHIQVLQFLLFKRRSLELVAQGSKDLIDEEGFERALYMIDIGQNDLAGQFAANLSYAQVLHNIPYVVAEIQNAIKTIYNNGGKNFWVHNTGPLGCLPQKLSLPRENNGDLDPYGCLMTLNNAAKEFNTQLSAVCDELSSELKNATIVYTDMYTIKYDLIANHTKYGFDSPLMACCGFGGPPYNYNQNITCGIPGFQVCAEGSRFVSWDGVHYTEFANAIIASKILSTDYSKPRVKFGYFCSS